MVSLFRPKIATYRLPDGKHRTPDGKRVTSNTPGAVKKTHKSKVWYGKYKTAAGTFRRIPLSTSKKDSKLELQKPGVDERLAAVGLGDQFEAHRKRLLVCPDCKGKGCCGDCPESPHLSDYRAHLEAKGNNEARYISQAIAHCVEVLTGIEARVIADIDANKVESWLADLRGPKVGPSTSNHYLTSIKGFTRWLTRTRPPRWPSDPLACLSKQNAEVDIRRRRRVLSLDDALRLLAAARASDQALRGLSGQDRYFHYAVAFQSGLRAGELASLTPKSFVLDGDPSGQARPRHHAGSGLGRRHARRGPCPLLDRAQLNVPVLLFHRFGVLDLALIDPPSGFLQVLCVAWRDGKINRLTAICICCYP
jgi:hypothetical protein